MTEANVVISGTGIFNPAVYPDIDGLDTFSGPSFHTSKWPDDVDLTDKRVAIIGNGASCMQTAPEIQDDVASLTIFQRSNHWAAPFEQFRREVPEPLRFLLREVPAYQAWYRVRLGWTFNDRLHSALQRDPDWEHPSARSTPRTTPTAPISPSTCVPSSARGATSSTRCCPPTRPSASAC